MPTTRKMLRVTKKPEVRQRGNYTVSEVASLVNRTRSQVNRDLQAGLLNGTWGEIRRAGSCQMGWLMAPLEVQRYVDYRWALVGNRSPGYNRGAKPTIRQLLEAGMRNAEICAELGVDHGSVSRVKRLYKIPDPGERDPRVYRCEVG